VHLPDEEMIYWKIGKEEQRLQQLDMPQATSKLTAWFALNEKIPEARALLYPEVPEHYA